MQKSRYGTMLFRIPRILYIIQYSIGPLDCDLSPLYCGGELTSTVIARYQHLLKCTYNAVGGLEDPAYGSEYSFSTQRGIFVQVLHVDGNHWIVASNVWSKQGT